MTERIFHIRKKDDHWSTLCGAEPRSSLSFLHYKFGLENPDSTVGRHILKIPGEICEVCKEAYENTTAMSER